MGIVREPGIVSPNPLLAVSQRCRQSRVTIGCQIPPDLGRRNRLSPAVLRFTEKLDGVDLRKHGVGVVLLKGPTGRHEQ